MNEQSVQKQYNQIVSLLEYKRLKEALVQLDAFLYNSNDWTLRTAWNKSRLPISICCNT